MWCHEVKHKSWLLKIKKNFAMQRLIEYVEDGTSKEIEILRKAASILKKLCISI